MPLSHPKILTLQEAKNIVAKWKAQGEIVVFTNGCFDILHAGHVDLLARSKAKGNRLIVGLNSNASVKRLGKGDERPINDEQQRAFVLAHLASVDAVIIFNEDTPLELIKALLPSVLIKGGDWKPEAIVGRKEVESAGGKVLSLPLLEDFSTTDIVKKINSEK